MLKHEYYVYILTNKKHGTLYIGVTNNLMKRIYTHKQGLVKGFTKKYNLHQLVYYEIYSSVREAILREKQLKRWNRNWKINLIEKSNPHWFDLYNTLFF